VALKRSRISLLARKSRSIVGPTQGPYQRLPWDWSTRLSAHSFASIVTPRHYGVVPLFKCVRKEAAKKGYSPRHMNPHPLVKQRNSKEQIFVKFHIQIFRHVSILVSIGQKEDTLHEYIRISGCFCNGGTRCSL
jgi:hypothetical protein